MMWILLCFALSKSELSYLSFKSPLIPDHTDYFNTLGDAIPLRKFVRLHPPQAYSQGALVTRHEINLTMFEVEIILNCWNSESTEITENVGATMWLSNQTYHLGNIYGLSEDFYGIAVTIDLNKNSLFLYQSFGNLTFEFIRMSSSCQLVMGKKQVSVHLKVGKNTVEVWLKEKRLVKCAEIAVSPVVLPVFGVSSHSGNTSSTFDVLQITTMEIESEELENEKLETLEIQTLEKLVEIEKKSNLVLENLKNIKESVEYAEIIESIMNFKMRLLSIVQKIDSIKSKILNLHIDDSFTKNSNKEILEVAEMFKNIDLNLDKTVLYVNSKDVIKEVYNIVESRYKLNSELGEKLSDEFNQAVTVFNKFEGVFENDNRILWLHAGLVIALISIIAIFVKIIRIEKVKLITQ